MIIPAITLLLLIAVSLINMALEAKMRYPFILKALTTPLNGYGKIPFPTLKLLEITA